MTKKKIKNQPYCATHSRNNENAEWKNMNTIIQVNILAYSSITKEG